MRYFERAAADNLPRKRNPLAFFLPDTPWCHRLRQKVWRTPLPVAVKKEHARARRRARAPHTGEIE